MATGGENFSYSIGSEDFCDTVCDPCQEDGKLHKAVGMCIDCKDHLCQKCFEAHKISKPSRKHELLDKEAMLQSQVSITKDRCTEKCAVHEEDVIKYYCINHNHLGCSVCITLDHRTCDSVRYIPHVAKDLAHNEEYQEANNQLISTVEKSKQVAEHNKKNNESIKKDCSDAVKMVQKYRKDINEILDKAEADILQQCETIKSEEIAKISQIVDIFKTTQTELRALMDMKEAYQNDNQNSNMYILMMKTKDKVKSAEERMKEVEKEQSNINSQIKFVANKDTLNTLKLPETLGKLLIPGTPRTTSQEPTEATQIQREPPTYVQKAETKRIVRAEYVKDINVQYNTDKKTCDISGLIILQNNMLVAIDYFNENVKLVDIKHSQVITCLTLSSNPHDVTMITNFQVAITMPYNKKVAMVNVSATAMAVERTLAVDGFCYGVDYRDDKLAVAFRDPDRVQVITLQGRVLHSITTDQQGHNLFNKPNYVVFGRDNNTSLYVSNRDSHNVVNVKFDGTVIGTYTDSELSDPRALFTDSSGHIYVCGRNSYNIHQITPDCRKIQVLLTKADGLKLPCSISYSETDCRLYLGMLNNNAVKVYRVILTSK